MSRDNRITVSEQHQIDSIDFVPSPSNLSILDQLSPIEVPYVAIFTYDFGGFEGFFDRLGFAKDSQLNLET